MSSYLIYRFGLKQIALYSASESIKSSPIIKNSKRTNKLSITDYDIKLEH